MSKNLCFKPTRFNRIFHSPHHFPWFRKTLVWLGCVALCTLFLSGSAAYMQSDPGGNLTPVETWKIKNIGIGPNAGNDNEKAVRLMPNVIRLDNGTFRMYFSKSLGPGKDDIRYADSLDAATWTVKGVILSGSSNPTDRTYIFGGPSVVRLDDGQFRMYYRTSDQVPQGAAPHHHIRSAISKDGVTFTEEPGIRIDVSPFDTSSPFMLAGHGSFYRTADGGFGGIFSGNLKDSRDPSDLFLTTSKDGLTWGNFKKLYPGFHDPTVVKKGNQYYLYAMYLHFYHARGISSDGVNWPTQLDKIILADQNGTDLTASRAGVGDLGAGVGPNGQIRLYTNYGNPSENIAQFDLDSAMAAAPTVSVTSPNGGERFEAGASLAAAWRSSSDKGIASHKIDLSTDGGTTFSRSLADGLPGTASSFTVRLPAEVTATRARLRVTATDASGLTGSDQSDTDFSITTPTQTDMPPTVVVKSPNGGESVAQGGTLQVNWNSTDDRGLSSHTVDLSVDGGATFQTSLVAGLPGNTTSFEAKLPANLVTATGRIRVTATDTSGKTGSDTSDGDFRVVAVDKTAPTVRVLSPNGGEKVVTNSSLTIRWEAADEGGLASHDLLLSTDGGTTFPVVLASGLSGADRSFTIVLPANQAKSKNARVRVVARDRAGNLGQDDSDGSFIIKRQ
ncbi:MAG: hypothetical protein K1Y36_16255 [Blastocatellia bacterium]|nr:hypothetical protein [Blastocatellia bacterium]